MRLTPRQEMVRRRDEYLSRISRFDGREPPPDVPLTPRTDPRVTDIRHFRAGGDDVPTGASYTRAMLADGATVRSQTDLSDWERFAQGCGRCRLARRSEASA